jgi:hypothetical protein
MSEPGDRPIDMSLREAADWASQQARRLADNFGLDLVANRDTFALAQW